MPKALGLYGSFMEKWKVICGKLCPGCWINNIFIPFTFRRYDSAVRFICLPYTASNFSSWKPNILCLLPSLMKRYVLSCKVLIFYNFGYPSSVQSRRKGRQGDIHEIAWRILSNTELCTGKEYDWMPPKENVCALMNAIGTLHFP